MSRRVIPSGSSEAPSGNSRSRNARDSGRSSRCARLRQYVAVTDGPRAVSRRIDGSFAIELRRERLDVPGRGPPHVGDLRDGASVGTGVAVTVEAPAHAEGRHLGDRFHLVDTTVAGDTADSRRHMHVVGEIGVVGKVVDANPAHRPAFWALSRIGASASLSRITV